MIELCSECLSVQCIWLYVLVMSRTRFRVNPHSIYSCLNFKELLARSRRDIWAWRDCNWTRTRNHLVRKRTFNHLAKLAKWLSCVLSTYLYGAFDYMLWVRVQLQSLKVYKLAWKSNLRKRVWQFKAGNELLLRISLIGVGGTYWNILIHVKLQLFITAVSV